MTTGPSISWAFAASGYAGTRDVIRFSAIVDAGTRSTLSFAAGESNDSGRVVAVSPSAGLFLGSCGITGGRGFAVTDSRRSVVGLAVLLESNALDAGVGVDAGAEVAASLA